MIDITNQQNCSGCSTCASVCSHNAIKMVPDGMGFMYPKVDKSICVDCGLCNKVCPFNVENKPISENPIKVLAARNKNQDEINKSRSGAVFPALFSWILEKGGVVYGAGYKEHFIVAHKRATTKNECDDFRGSKYTQSDIIGIFKSVKKDLQDGLLVLFSGTPCQVAGIKSFIGENLKKNLFLIDIVCHGVPSPAIWAAYLDYIEKKNNNTIIKADFRDKEHYGWTAHFESFHFKDGSWKGYRIFTDLFYKHIMLRPSCGSCVFANLNRVGDITLGDFWGWQKVDKEFNKDDKGCSLILCNTPKGLNVMNEISPSFDLLETSTDKCMQPNLQHPSVLSPYSSKFEKLFLKEGFESVASRYGIIGWRYKAKLIEGKIKSWIWKLTHYGKNK